MSKRMKESNSKIDPNKVYELEEAIKLVKETSAVKFDASVEIHAKLGINTKKSDQHIRSTVVLPHGTGKTQKQSLEFLKKLNSELPGIMELELDGFFERGLWVTTRAGTTGAKKKYALVDKQGKLKIRGFETVRRDWCPLAREVQNKIIRQILKQGNEKKSLEYVKKIITKIKQREIDKDDLIIRTQLKKPISEYLSISPHVIAAKKMQEQEIPIKLETHYIFGKW